MDNQTEILKQKLSTLTSSYVKTYNGKQPILTIEDVEKLKAIVEPEFLTHLPPNTSSAVSVLVKEFNNG